MYFNKIKPHKFNSVVRISGSEYLEKETLEKLYKAHQKDLDDFGYKLKGEKEVKEYTMDEVAEALGKNVNEIRIKKE